MAKSKDGFKKVMFSFFGLLIAVVVIYHSFASLFDPYVTQEAVETTVKETVSAECYIIRKENVITSDNKGFKVYKTANGGKVSKDSSVISFYKNAEDVATANEINALENYLNQIEEIDKQNSIHMADLKIISEQTESNIYSFLNSVNNNQLSDAENSLSELRYYIAQGQLATGREENYSKVIKKTKNKLKQLKSKYDKNIETVKSEYSGYFVNFVDGYESSINYDNISEITVDDIENLAPQEISENQVGRVISENEWYIVTVLNTAEIKSLSKGDKVRISTNLSGTEELVVTVKAVNKNESGGKSAVVFSCMEMNEELSSIRKQNMQIVLKTYKGLKINSDSVRVRDGKKGVYIKLGTIKKFVETDIIYNSKDYCIVSSNNASGELRIYDDVIVKGKGLDE